MSSCMKKLTLKSSDGEEFEVELEVAEEFQTIKHMIEDGCADDVIPLPNVTGNVMAKVIEYSRKHVQARNEQMSSPHDNEAKATLKKWDADFVKVNEATLLQLILAANYLSAKGLLNLMCQTAADMIQKMSVEEIRKMFNVENDFSPEEEAEIRRESHWAFK